MKATDIRVETVEVTFDDERLSVPLHLSRGVIEAITYAKVIVHARTRAGGGVQGVGAILLSDVWAYPAPDLTHEQKDQLMRRLCTAISAWLEDDLYEDPIEKGARLERAAVVLAVQLADEEPLLQKAPFPRLAVLNCMAPFDAALHDAWGAALPVPLYAAYTAAYLNQDLSASLGPDFAGRYPADYLSPRRRALAVQHVVGFNDALTPAEVDRQQPTPAIFDRRQMSENLESAAAKLPVDLTSWIARDRVRYLKLKLRGQSPTEDAERLIEVHTVASQALDAAGVPGGPRLSVDPNEGYQQPNMMLEMLDSGGGGEAATAAGVGLYRTAHPARPGSLYRHAPCRGRPRTGGRRRKSGRPGQSRPNPSFGLVRAGGEDLQGPYSLTAGLLLGPPSPALSHPARPHQPRPGTGSQRQLLRPPAFGRGLFRMQPAPVYAPVAATGKGRLSGLFQLTDGQLALPAAMGSGLY